MNYTIKPNGKYNRLQMFHDWLLKQLQDKGWTQADLSRSSGLTKGAISNYINGRIPDEDAIRKIAKALKLPPEFVYEKAGKLPAKIELSPVKRKLVHIAESLPDSDVETAIALLEQREAYYKKNPQAKPSK